MDASSKNAAEEKDYMTDRGKSDSLLEELCHYFLRQYPNQGYRPRDIKTPGRESQCCHKDLQVF